MNQFVSLFSVLFALLLFACNTSVKQQHDVLDFVDPFIGTGGHVHTFPGATVPFGMVQLSPDGGTTGWDWCSGYHQSDSSLLGFSHTHLSGTGWSDLGDILVMASTGNVQMERGTKANPDSGFRSRFNHQNESAAPGYYQVFLSDYEVNAELTTTERVGVHRYTFKNAGEGHILFDPTNKIFGRTLLSQVAIDNNTVKGYSYSTGWGGKRTTYFTATFSKGFKAFGTYSNGEKEPGSASAQTEDARAWVTFDVEEGEAIEVYVAISGVSQEGADKNLKAEVSDKNFDTVLAEAQNKPHMD